MKNLKSFEHRIIIDLMLNQKRCSFYGPWLSAQFHLTQTKPVRESYSGHMGVVAVWKCMKILMCETGKTLVPCKKRQLEQID